MAWGINWSKSKPHTNNHVLLNATQICKMRVEFNYTPHACLGFKSGAYKRVMGQKQCRVWKLLLNVGTSLLLDVVNIPVGIKLALPKEAALCVFREKETGLQTSQEKQLPDIKIASFHPKVNTACDWQFFIPIHLYWSQNKSTMCQFSLGAKSA